MLSDTIVHLPLITFNDMKVDNVKTLSPADVGSRKTGTTTTLIMKQAHIY